MVILYKGRKLANLEWRFQTQVDGGSMTQKKKLTTFSSSMRSVNICDVCNNLETYSRSAVEKFIQGKWRRYHDGIERDIRRIRWKRNSSECCIPSFH